jgi:putative aldouronate transport system permease protein
MHNRPVAEGAQAIRKGRAAATWAAMVQHRYFYALLLPAVAILVVMHYVPMAGIVIAFKQFNIKGGLWRSPWVGLKYFEQMVETPSFLRIIWNTIRISFLKVLFGFPAPIFFALVLNEIPGLRARRIFQTISYLPHFLSWVVVAGLVLSLLSVQGPVNSLLASWGRDPVIFMQEPRFFTGIVVISDIWKEVGWGSIIYLAAIAGIDVQLYEAAAIDGARRLQRIRHITLPSLVPIIVTLFILRIGGLLNAGFDQILNLYNPLVLDVGEIIDTYVYRMGLVQMQYSFSAAVGISKNVVGFLLVILTNSIVNRAGGTTLT